jgi:hypothetical protein
VGQGPVTLYENHSCSLRGTSMASSHRLITSPWGPPPALTCTAPESFQITLASGQSTKQSVHLKFHGWPGQQGHTQWLQWE